jgi:hypothetical protein
VRVHDVAEVLLASVLPHPDSQPLPDHNPE